MNNAINEQGRQQTPYGKFFQEARESKGLSINELAKRAQVDRQVIWAIENKIKPKISIQDHQAIMDQLDLGAPYLHDKDATRKISSLKFKCMMLSEALDKAKN